MFENKIPAGTWTIDPAHSSVEFQVKHLMVSKVKGKFGEFVGRAIVTHDSMQVTAIVDVATIDTNNKDRDAHLKSADFFEVDKYAEASFVSTGFIMNNDSEGELAGDLTIHGVTRGVIFKVEFGGVVRDPAGSVKAALEGKTKISRSDFGLTWNTALESGGVLVSDEVTILFEVQAVLEV